MARTMVTDDDMNVCVELVMDLVTGHWRAYCSACTPAYDRFDSGADLLHDSRERFNLDDAEQFASLHIDYRH